MTLWLTVHITTGWGTSWGPTKGCWPRNIWWQWLLSSHIARVYSTQEQLRSCYTYKVSNLSCRLFVERLHGNRLTSYFFKDTQLTSPCDVFASSFHSVFIAVTAFFLHLLMVAL